MPRPFHLSFLAILSFSRHCKLVFVLRYRKGNTAVRLLSLNTDTLLLMSLLFLFFFFFFFLHLPLLLFVLLLIIVQYLKYAGHSRWRWKTHKKANERKETRHKQLFYVLFYERIEAKWPAVAAFWRHITRLSEPVPLPEEISLQRLYFYEFLLHLIVGGISSFDSAECVDAPSVCGCREYFFFLTRPVLVLRRFSSAPMFDDHICCFRFFLLTFLFFFLFPFCRTSQRPAIISSQSLRHRSSIIAH